MVFMRVLYTGCIGTWRCWVLWREQNRRTRRKNPRSKASTNNKLNPHTAPGRNRTRATLVGGESSRHCATPAPQRQTNRTLNKYWMETSYQLTVCIVQFTHITLSWCCVIVNSGAVKLVKEKKPFSMRCTESHYDVRRRTPTPHGP